MKFIMKLNYYAVVLEHVNKAFDYDPHSFRPS